MTIKSIFFFLFSDSLRQLLLEHAKAKNYEKVEKMYDLCVESNTKFAPMMLTVSIESFAKLNQGDKARKAFERLRQQYSHFRIKPYQIVILAKTMINDNLMNEAKKFLQENAPKTPEYIENIKVNIIHLLDAVGEWSQKNNFNENMSKELLDELVKLNYCEYTRVTCGSIIKEHILKNELEFAVDEFERIASEHGFLTQELTLMKSIVHLINTENDNKKAKELLQRVIGISRQTNPSLTYSNLVIATAYSGNEQQLRGMLMNPKIELNEQYISKYIENHFKTSDSIRCFVKFAKCNRGLKYEIFREENIIGKILDHLLLTNDFELAKEIYNDLIQDDDYRMHQTIAKKFLDIFTQTNQEIPAQLKIANLWNKK